MTLFNRIAAGHGWWLRILLDGYADVAEKSRRRSLKPQSCQFGIGRPICSRTAGLQRRKARMSCKQARQRGRPVCGRICGLSVAVGSRFEVAVIGLRRSKRAWIPITQLMGTRWTEWECFQRGRTAMRGGALYAGASRSTRFLLDGSDAATLRVLMGGLLR
jgi:hypothetical protein